MRKKESWTAKQQQVLESIYYNTFLLQFTEAYYQGKGLVQARVPETSWTYTKFLVCHIEVLLPSKCLMNVDRMNKCGSEVKVEEGMSRNNSTDVSKRLPNVFGSW